MTYFPGIPRGFKFANGDAKRKALLREHTQRRIRHGLPNVNSTQAGLLYRLGYTEAQVLALTQEQAVVIINRGILPSEHGELE